MTNGVCSLINITSLRTGYFAGALIRTCSVLGGALRTDINFSRAKEKGEKEPDKQLSRGWRRVHGIYNIIIGACGATFCILLHCVRDGDL